MLVKETDIAYIIFVLGCFQKLYLCTCTCKGTCMFTASLYLGLSDIPHTCFTCSVANIFFFFVQVEVTNTDITALLYALSNFAPSSKIWLVV